MFSEALTNYKEALRYWLPLLSAHFFVRLIVLALLLPVIGGLLAITLSFSDQSALTDQDIARFLLTPAGALGALVIAAMIFAAAVVDIAVMTTVLRTRSQGFTTVGSMVLGFLSTAMPRILQFAVLFILRVLVLSVPFLAVAAVVAAYLLRDYDINFYLANRTLAFQMAVGFGALCLLGLAALLLERLTAWAVALHLNVFDRESPRRAFSLSRNYMQGHRVALVRRMLAWFAIRFVAATALVTVAGFFLAEVPQLFAHNLGMFFASTAVLLVFWLVANGFLNAISNGALADILNDEFNRCLEARPAKADVSRPPAFSRHLVTPLVILVLAIGALGLGGTLSNELGGIGKVEVIAHRGAAGSRPENTMASIVKAIEDGADWVEIDVQETADDEVLVVHDSDFMKAAGVPTKVWDVTMEDVAQIDIGSWFDPDYAEERAPLLRDVLEVIRDRSKLLIELKYYGHDVDLENRVIALVEEARMEDQIATMSLKYPAVQKMRELRPDWRSGVLAATAIGDLTGLESDFLAVSMGRVTARLVATADASGKDVYAWTVNDAVSMSRMISLGVDGLITDEPALARNVIAYYQTLSTPERLLLRLGDTIGFTFDFTPEGDEI